MAIKVTKGQISNSTISQKHVLRSIIYVESSDAPIPLFHYWSDTKYILADTDWKDTVPDTHDAHKKSLFAKQTSLSIS